MRTAIILPILGGVALPSKAIELSFRIFGWNTTVLTGIPRPKTYDKKNLGSSVAQAIDHAKEQIGEYDPKKTVLIGTSFGGVLAAHLTIDCPRIIIMGGTPIREILQYSDEPHVVNWRGDTQLDMDYIKPHPAKRLVFVTLFDKSVPTRYQKNLRGDKVYLPTGHYTALIALPFILIRSLLWARRVVS